MNRIAGIPTPPPGGIDRQTSGTPNHRVEGTRRNRDEVDPQIRQAAEGMEAMFMDYMMKTMRETVPKNDMDLESPATQIYRGMLDSETVQRAVHQGGVGLADQIIAYLEARSYTKGQGRSNEGMATNSTAEAVGSSTGGTDAGQSRR